MITAASSYPPANRATKTGTDASLAADRRLGTVSRADGSRGVVTGPSPIDSRVRPGRPREPGPVVQGIRWSTIVAPRRRESVTWGRPESVARVGRESVAGGHSESGLGDSIESVT